MSHQGVFPPAAGFVSAIPATPFEPFPSTSIQRIRWAMAAPIDHPPAKAALIVLCVYANTSSGRAWPSISSLAKDISYSRRTTVAALRRLQELGWVARLERDNDTSVYWPKAPDQRLCPDCHVRVPASESRCPSCGGGGCRSCMGGMQHVHPKYY